MDALVMKKAFKLQAKNSMPIIWAMFALGFVLAAVILIVISIADKSAENILSAIPLVGCFLSAVVVAFAVFIFGAQGLSMGFTSAVKFGAGRKSYLVGSMAFFTMISVVFGEGLWALALAVVHLPGAEKMLEGEAELSAFLLPQSWWIAPVAAIVFMAVLMIFGAVMTRFGGMGFLIMYFGGCFVMLFLPGIVEKYLKNVVADFGAFLPLIIGIVLVAAFIWSLWEYMRVDVS